MFKEGYQLEIEVDISLIDKLSHAKKIPASFVHVPTFENQYYVLKTDNVSLPALCRNQQLVLVTDLDAQAIYSYKKQFLPKGIRQKIALKYLYDDATKCVILLGKAGTAKTFLSLSYALKSLEDRKYENVYLIKPIIPIMQGEYLGTLPGGLDEKIEPFMQSFFDAVQSLNLVRTFESYLDMKVIQFQPVSYIRGRHLENALVIVDECQNLSAESLIAVATRISAIGSKLVLLLDPNTIQKDHKKSAGVQPLLDDPLNRIINHPDFGLIHLTNRMRSTIGAVIEDVLTDSQEQS